MYLYLPERIYDIIKDEPKYQEINSYIEKTMISESFEESFYNSDVFVKSEKGMIYMNELENLIKDKCPQYLDEFDIVMNDSYLKKDLVDMYENNEYDIETKLFLISQIINNSYADNTYQQWMRVYIENIPINDEKIMKSLASYCHENYMLNSSVIYANEIEINEKFLDENIKFLKKYKEKIESYIGESDTITHNYLEGIRYVFSMMFYRVKDPSLCAKMIDNIESHKTFDEIEFQYNNHSYALMDIYDKCFDAYFTNREINKAFTILESMISYIDESLSEGSIFFRGLQYFDKINQYNMALIIRKLIKLSYIFPKLNLKLNNLKDSDRKFILMDEDEFDYNRFPTNQSIIGFKRYLNHMTDIIKNNKQTFELINKFGIREYLRYKGDKSNV